MVVDRDWLEGLFAAWQRNVPEAGGFSGLVLPYRLDTEAQVQFELPAASGAASTADFHAASAEKPAASGRLRRDRRRLQHGVRPVAAARAGRLRRGAGYRRAVPGGGDLDIFYRVLRSGRAIVYEPRYAVYHEHRETLPQLKRQYWTWGLGFMAFLAKSRRSDPALKRKQAAILRWWLLDKLAELAVAACCLGSASSASWPPSCGAASSAWLGEYDRSLKRVQKIREQAS